MCSRCSSIAHFDFGQSHLLCASCAVWLLERCRLPRSAPEADKATAGDGRPAPAPAVATNSELVPPQRDRQAAVIVPAHAVAAANLIPDIPDFLDRRLSSATFADGDIGDQSKRSEREDHGNHNFRHRRNSDLEMAGVNTA